MHSKYYIDSKMYTLLQQVKKYSMLHSSDCFLKTIKLHVIKFPFLKQPNLLAYILSWTDMVENCMILTIYPNCSFLSKISVNKASSSVLQKLTCKQAEKDAETIGMLQLNKQQTAP